MATVESAHKPVTEIVQQAHSFLDSLEDPASSLPSAAPKELADRNVPRWKLQRLVVGEKDAIR